MNDNNTTNPSSSERIRELKLDSTLWATPAKIINLLDFKPEKLSINTNDDTAESSSSERIKVHQVRYESGGFYLTIDNIKVYFNFTDNIGTLDMIFFNDDQRDKYHQNLTIINHNGNHYRVNFAFISKKDANNLIKNATIIDKKGIL